MVVLGHAGAGLRLARVHVGLDARVRAVSSMSAVVGQHPPGRAVGAVAAMLNAGGPRHEARADHGLRRLCSGRAGGHQRLLRLRRSLGRSVIGAAAGAMVVAGIFFWERRGVDDPAGVVRPRAGRPLGDDRRGAFANGKYGRGWNGVAPTPSRGARRRRVPRAALWRRLATGGPGDRGRRGRRGRLRHGPSAVQAQPSGHANAGVQRGGTRRARRSRNMAGLGAIPTSPSAAARIVIHAQGKNATGQIRAGPCRPGRTCGVDTPRL